MARQIFAGRLTKPLEAIEVNRPYLAIAVSTKNAQPTAPKTKLTIQDGRFFVSAEIAAIAIAIWNTVTPRAKESLPAVLCLRFWQSVTRWTHCEQNRLTAHSI